MDNRYRVVDRAANTDNFISSVSLVKFSSFAVLELRCWCLRLLVIVDVLRHLPDLHDVVLRHRADHPGVIRVPTEVGDLGSVTSVDEEELRGAILCVLGALLLADLGEVPHVQPPVGARAGQDSLVMGRPLDLGQTNIHFSVERSRFEPSRLPGRSRPYDSRSYGA